MTRAPTSPVRLWQAARIVEDEDGDRWLEFAPLSACARCRSGQGCGASQWARLFGEPGASRLPLPEDCTLPAGSPVRAGIQARALLKAATLAYLVPLLGFVATLAALDALDLPEAASLIAGLGVAFAMLLAGRRAMRRGLHPRVEPARPDCGALESGAG